MSLAAATLGVGGPVEAETEPCTHATAAEDRCKSEDCDSKEDPYDDKFHCGEMLVGDGRDALLEPPCAVPRWLSVHASRPPTVRQNAFEVLPQASSHPRFHLSLCVLRSLRLCHISAAEDSQDVHAGKVLRVLRSCDADADLGKDLRRFAGEMDEDVVLKVLQKQRSNWQVALPFFTWAAGLPTYTHGPRTYTEMLDILGRMKKVRQMRQLFDEIPEKRCGSVVTNRMFAVLLNRYAGAHKVQEAIKMFYRRKECGFEVDLVGFQKAEALFLQKKDEFPPVIKSWNIILNGWCVKGSLADAKRVWNQIIASKL
ncbi:hypothetical protein ACQ4PT_028280 [Festuca glaucescens]